MRQAKPRLLLVYLERQERSSPRPEYRCIFLPIMTTSHSSKLDFAKAPNVRTSDGRWTFRVEYDSWGHLQLIDSEGRVYTNVSIIPMFPLTSPESGVSITDQEFDELLCVGNLDSLPSESANRIRQELRLREFVPTIQRVVSVSGKTEPCEWIVDTNHGRTSFVLNAEEDVHRVSNKSVNIIDANGLRFRVEDLTALDRRSRAFVEWYV